MSEEKKWTTLYDDYPNLFQNRFKSPQESCLSFGVECSLGWYEILDHLCWKIKQHEDNIKWHREFLEKNDPEKLASEPEYFPVKFDQVKEKYGGLRVYFSGGDKYVEGLVGMAESISYSVCEICGNKGEANKGGWISVRCEAHRNS